VVITALYPLSILYKRVAARGTEIAKVNWTAFAVKDGGNHCRRVRHGRKSRIMER